MMLNVPSDNDDDDDDVVADDAADDVCSVRAKARLVMTLPDNTHRERKTQREEGRQRENGRKGKRESERRWGNYFAAYILYMPPSCSID